MLVDCGMSLMIELPSGADVLDFNRRRWAEIVEDPELAKVPGKVETNRHGQVLMMPPATGGHSSRQGEIGYQLRLLLGGRALPECPISTVDGVRAADVGWYSDARFVEVDGQLVFERAPEICVEVGSPSNSKRELEEKAALYFEAGAEEVWLCQLDGRMQFFLKEGPLAGGVCSAICSDFPETIT